MKQTFYSNGKLLITGEYVVLNGAKALALPTKFGQNLIVEPSEKSSLSWTSYDADGSIWFESEISFDQITTNKHFEHENTIKTTLINILHEAYKLNSEFLNKKQGYKITTELTFPKIWGLGTSSTLINNVAQWFEIDAFRLLKNSFGGSGYDIACAQNDTPIFYKLVDENPIIEIADFNFPFKNRLFFIYLNKKQSSKSAIEAYYKKQVSINKTIQIVNKLTNSIATTEDSKEFAQSLKKHENEMSSVLELKTVQELLFPDFDGVIKSLGAWGGDFVLAFSEQNPTDYFNKKGYKTVLTYHEMIL